MLAPAAETSLDVRPPFITRWDLDKTYLRTEFDTLSDLFRTAIERPDQKRAVPGAAALLRGLGETGARVHILSGSPRQLRARLEEKLRIDQVRWDELTLKPNLSNMLRLRFRALRDQLGYKLPALLTARERDQGAVESETLHEVLVGDDAEADAFVYSLYADICEGRVDARTLDAVLREGNVYAEERRVCLDTLPGIRKGPVVERILIHLDRQSPPSHFDAYAPRVVPFYNYLQAAFVLAEDGRLSGLGILDVATTLVRRHRFDAEALARSYLDLLRRGQGRGSATRMLREGLALLSAELEVRDTLERFTALVEGYEEAPPAARPKKTGPLDYLELARRHRGGKNRKRFQSLSR